MQTVHKFRLYPTSEQEQSLLFVMEVCRWVYNQFLSTWNNAARIPGRYDLQAILPELKKVNSKILQMVLFMLYNNLKVLRELKKNGRRMVEKQVDYGITNMVRNYNLSQSILDSSWRNFFCILSYKAESAGKILIKVDPGNTSKECSICGNVQDMPLSERMYNCSECGIAVDRDVNAETNILKRGITRQGLPSTLLEMAPLQNLLQVSASAVVEGRSPLR